ncbi:hypothetical protein J5N97_014846 [Dioscorea zingiberensis]|uniref:Protein kinase domain-containing protein n=1 Tax=Dioscorea zingiberensis TaxID=325984 RepID=A0A9D5CUQ2_9LILI|nr:hypothetical protein J5N97_014846 [Dioscorea zingiberensis]
MEIMSKAKRGWRRGSFIGRGSFGAVYLATDDGDSPLFAVKTVASSSPSPSQAMAMVALENEIRILRSLSSPYIVSYLGDDVTHEPKLGACRNLLLEYMAGGTVGGEKKLGGLDESEIKSYTRCLVRGLHYLHAIAGVVHGDVKGRNMLVGAGPGVAKLSDFGSSRKINSGVNRETERMVGGTPLWMAPEVARGGRQSPESDVWSLGCTVIEMVTGEQPWGRRGSEGEEEVGSVLFKIGYGEEVPEVPAGMSAAGKDFIGKCLRREARERWSCEELLRHPFLGEEDGLSGPSPRSVLDWGSLEFSDDEGGEGSSSSSSSSSSGYEELARKRVRELATEGGVVGWEMMSWDGWEVVRGVEENGELLQSYECQRCENWMDIPGV